MKLVKTCFHDMPNGGTAKRNRAKSGKASDLHGGGGAKPFEAETEPHPNPNRRGDAPYHEVVLKADKLPEDAMDLVKRQGLYFDKSIGGYSIRNDQLEMFNRAVENGRRAKAEAAKPKPDPLSGYTKTHETTPEKLRGNASAVKSFDTMDAVAQQYGWKVENGALYNWKGVKIHDVEMKNGRIRLSSNGVLRGSLASPENIGSYMEKTFYSEKVKRA